MKIDPDHAAAIDRDLMVYGNAVVHYANIDGKLKARRLNPLEVFPDMKPIVEPDTSWTEYSPQ